MPSGTSCAGIPESTPSAVPGFPPARRRRQVDHDGDSSKRYSSPPATGTGTDPLPPRLTLAPLPHQGPLDGAWWPRTRRPAAELNTLVAGLASRGVVATRLSLGATRWDSTPGRLRLDDRDVRLIWFAYRTPHTVIVGHGVDELTLLVIPPGATETSAARAIALASDPGNVTGANDILTASEAPSHAQEA